MEIRSGFEIFEGNTHFGLKSKKVYNCCPKNEVTHCTQKSNFYIIKSVAKIAHITVDQILSLTKHFLNLIYHNLRKNE